MHSLFEAHHHPGVHPASLHGATRAITFYRKPTRARRRDSIPDDFIQRPEEPALPNAAADGGGGQRRGSMRWDSAESTGAASTGFMSPAANPIRLVSRRASAQSHKLSSGSSFSASFRSQQQLPQRDDYVPRRSLSAARSCELAPLPPTSVFSVSELVRLHGAGDALLALAARSSAGEGAADGSAPPRAKLRRGSLNGTGSTRGPQDALSAANGGASLVSTASVRRSSWSMLVVARRTSMGSTVRGSRDSGGSNLDSSSRQSCDSTSKTAAPPPLVSGSPVPHAVDHLSPSLTQRPPMHSPPLGGWHARKTLLAQAAVSPAAADERGSAERAPALDSHVGLEASSPASGFGGSPESGKSHTTTGSWLLSQLSSALLPRRASAASVAVAREDGAGLRARRPSLSARALTAADSIVEVASVAGASMDGTPSSERPATPGADDAISVAAAGRAGHDTSCLLPRVAGVGNDAPSHRHSADAWTEADEPPGSVAAVPDTAAGFTAVRRAAAGGAPGFVLRESTDDELDNDGYTALLPVAFYHPHVTIVFIHLPNLNELSARAQPLALVSWINEFFGSVDDIAEACGVYKVSATATMWLGAAGLLDAAADHPQRVARAALRVLHLALDRDWRLACERVTVQIGIHCGDVAAGVIGTRTPSFSIYGDSVNVASRLCSGSLPGCIQVSGQLAHALVLSDDACGDGGSSRARETEFLVTPRGPTFFKGKGLLDTYWLSDANLDRARQLERSRRTSTNTAVAALEGVAPAPTGPFRLRSLATRDDSELPPRPTSRASETAAAAAAPLMSPSRLDLNAYLASAAVPPSSTALQPSADSSGGGSRRHLGPLTSARRVAARLRTRFAGRRATTSSRSLAVLHGGGLEGALSAPSSSFATASADAETAAGARPRWELQYMEASGRRFYAAGRRASLAPMSELPHAPLEVLPGATSEAVAAMFSHFSQARTEYSAEAICRDEAHEKETGSGGARLERPPCALPLALDSTAGPAAGDSSTCARVSMRSTIADVARGAAAAISPTARRLSSGAAAAQHCGALLEGTHAADPASTKLAPPTRCGSIITAPACAETTVVNVDEATLPGNAATARGLHASTALSLVGGCAVRGACDAAVVVSVPSPPAAPTPQQQQRAHVATPLCDAAAVGNVITSADRVSARLVASMQLTGRWLHWAWRLVSSMRFHSPALESRYQLRSTTSGLKLLRYALPAAMLTFYLPNHWAGDINASAPMAAAHGVLYAIITTVWLLAVVIRPPNFRRVVASFAAGDAVALPWTARWRVNELLGFVAALAFFAPPVVAMCAASAAFLDRYRRLHSLLAFVIGMSISYMDLPGSVTLAANACLLGVYLLAVTAHAPPHVLLVTLGLSLGVVGAVLRERSRRLKFLASQHANQQHDACMALLARMLPSAHHVERLMAGEQVVESLPDVSFLHADIKGFTQLSADLSPEALVRFLDALYTAFDRHLAHFGLTKVETIGDAIIVVGGLVGTSISQAELLLGAPAEAAAVPPHSPSSSVVGASTASAAMTASGGGSGTAASAHGGTATGSQRPAALAAATAVPAARATAAVVGRTPSSSGGEPLQPPLGHLAGSSPLSRWILRTFDVMDAGQSAAAQSVVPPAYLPPPGVADASCADADHSGYPPPRQSDAECCHGLSPVSTVKALTSMSESAAAFAASGAGSRHGEPMQTAPGLASRHGWDAAAAMGARIASGDDATDERHVRAHCHRGAAATAGASAGGGARHLHRPRAAAAPAVLLSAGSPDAAAAAARARLGSPHDAPQPTAAAVVVRSLLAPDGSPLQPLSTSMFTRGFFSHFSSSLPLSPSDAAARGGAAPAVNAVAAASISSRAIRPSLCRTESRTGSVLRCESTYPSAGGMAAPAAVPVAPPDPAQQPQPPSQQPPADWLLPPPERQALSHTGALALFAMDMLQEVSRIRAQTGIPVELRIGLHRGRAVGGVLGKTRPRYFLFGADTVIAEHMEATCVPGQIQVSAPAAAALHGEGFSLEPFQRVPVAASSLAPPLSVASNAALSGVGGSMETFLLRAYVTPDGAAELLVLPPVAPGGAPGPGCAGGAA